MNGILCKINIILFVALFCLCIPLWVEGGECKVVAGDPVFFSESGIEQCMDIMASLMESNESFATGAGAYRNKLQQLVAREQALVLQEDLDVRIVARKDYVRGLVRLPGVKILALEPVSGNEVWVFLDSIECQ
jgi:hypothetical protein